MKKTIVTLAITVGAIFLPISQSKAQSTITKWTFENDSIATNLSPAPSIGTGTATSLGMGIYQTPAIGSNAPDVLLGVTADTGSNGVSNTSNIWRVRAKGGSGTNAANGWSSSAPIGTQGAEFAESTVGYSNINIRFDWYTTTQGEANLMFRYTTDGSTWNNATLSLSGSDGGLNLLTNSSSSNTVMGSYVQAIGQNWFTGLTVTVTNSNAANDPNFAFEVVNASTGIDCIAAAGSALNNTSGNWRFDNVTVSGTAVPEPSTYALFIVAISLLLAAGFRRTKSNI